MTKADIVVALKGRKHGARYCWYLIQEAHAAQVPVSLAFAICEQESNFSNIFGHDPTIFAGAGLVTKSKYLSYKASRGHSRMQGVGPMQLTWWEFQDRADALGGCWKPRFNIRVSLQDLAAMIHLHGTHTGIARYNGSGSAAENYANQVQSRQTKWHNYLYG